MSAERACHDDGGGADRDALRTAPVTFKRWLFWNLRCRRGRVCANLALTRFYSTLPGVSIAVTWTCDACGTAYVNEAIAGAGGAYTLMGRAEANR